MSYSEYLTNGANRIRLMTDNADAALNDEAKQVYLFKAAVIGCNTLKDISGDSAFRRDLKEVAGRGVFDEESRRILTSLDSFEEFLTKERKVMTEGGFNPFLAEQITGWCRGLREKVLTGGASVAEIMDAISSLEGQACMLSLELKSRLQTEREKRKYLTGLKIVTLGVAGAALAGLNAAAGVAAAPATGGLSLGAATVSAVFGGEMIKSAASFKVRDSIHDRFTDL